MELVDFLAERYKWTIEYIGNLNVIQVNSLLKGISEKNKTKSPLSKENKVGNAKEINNPMQLFGISGINVTPAMKKKLEAMKRKKVSNG